MRFQLPHEALAFEIPDEWLQTANVLSFKPAESAFTASSDSEFPTQRVRLADVKAPERDVGVAWFQRERMVSILRAFASGQVLPPLKVDEPPTQGRFRFRVREGFHRYYASAAVGFPELPVAVIPYY